MSHVGGVIPGSHFLLETACCREAARAIATNRTTAGLSGNDSQRAAVAESHRHYSRCCRQSSIVGGVVAPLGSSSNSQSWSSTFRVMLPRHMIQIRTSVEAANLIANRQVLHPYLPRNHPSSLLYFSIHPPAFSYGCVRTRDGSLS